MPVVDQHVHAKSYVILKHYMYNPHSSGGVSPLQNCSTMRQKQVSVIINNNIIRLLWPPLPCADDMTKIAQICQDR